MSNMRGKTDEACALVGGSPPAGRRLKRAWDARLAAACRFAGRVRAYAQPGCQTAARRLWCWLATATMYARSARAQITSHVLAHALYSGETSADLDKRACIYRAVMWVLLTLAALTGVVFGWKAAVVPLALAILAGMMALIVWSVSAQLESRERRFWE